MKVHDKEMLKIGIFDSGLGGLTVVKALKEVIQNAHIYYVADTANAPYGEKASEQILQYSLDITQHLIDTHEIDALIASLIIIGTEPGIKPAIEQTKTGKIGVLATPSTLEGDKYQQLATALATQKDVILFEQACPGLVEQIEKGEIDSVKTKALLEKWLQPMRDNDVDTIVLGCTHYPLVGETIKEIMLCNVTLVHTGEAISKYLLNLALKQGHTNHGDLNIQVYSTGQIDNNIVNKILQKPKLINSIKI